MLNHTQHWRCQFKTTWAHIFSPGFLHQFIRHTWMYAVEQANISCLGPQADELWWQTCQTSQVFASPTQQMIGHNLEGLLEAVHIGTLYLERKLEELLNVTSYTCNNLVWYRVIYKLWETERSWTSVLNSKTRIRAIKLVWLVFSNFIYLFI